MNQNPNNKIIFFFFPSTKRTPQKLVSFSLTDKLEGMVLEEGQSSGSVDWLLLQALLNQIPYICVDVMWNVLQWSRLSGYLQSDFKKKNYKFISVKLPSTYFNSNLNYTWFAYSVYYIFFIVTFITQLAPSIFLIVVNHKILIHIQVPLDLSN